MGFGVVVRDRFAARGPSGRAVVATATTSGRRQEDVTGAGGGESSKLAIQVFSWVKCLSTSRPVWMEYWCDKAPSGEQRSRVSWPRMLTRWEGRCASAATFIAWFASPGLVKPPRKRGLGSRDGWVVR